jgi:c-di-GMP-specific phosphodiesterase
MPSRRPEDGSATRTRRSARARIGGSAGLTPVVARAGIILFHYDAAEDQLRLSGPTQRLGLDGLRPGAGAGSLARFMRPESASALLALRSGGKEGAAVQLDLVTLSGRSSAWRGSWITAGAECAGVVMPVELAGPTETVTAEPNGRIGIDRRERDPLTSLLTRAGFLQALAARLAVQPQLRVVVGDVARVRRMNEALGYAMTDKVLTALAERLRLAFGDVATPARVGDNTFAIIASPDDLDAAQRLRAAMERPMQLDELTLHPALETGEAGSDPHDRHGPQDVLQRAEAALGLAKFATRSRMASMAGDAPHDSLTRLTLEDDLRSALARGEIEAFYQPVIRLADGRLAGFEALARWRHPRRGLLPPDDFLPLVSETGLAAAFGLFMVEAAARQAAEWRGHAQLHDDLFISVNLTTADLERSSVVEDVARIMREHRLAAGSLKIEITEGEVMRDPDSAASLLTELRAAGAGLSLDDFGMGYSSLSWLARLPISTLKIDQYFVRTMDSNEGSAKIVRSVIALARDFGLEVIAEGVQTPAAAETLRTLGCDYGQGFGYAPPLCAGEAEIYALDRALADLQVPPQSAL